MLTDQSQWLYLHKTVRTLHSCVSVKRMQFLFYPPPREGGEGGAELCYNM